MKQLFLISGRLSDPIQSKMQESFQKDPSQVKILFSSNATDGKYPSWEDPAYVVREYDKLIEYWYQVDRIDLREYLGDITWLQEFIKTYDALFFTWGMWYVLNNLLFELKFQEWYPDMVEAWLIHIWFSAGAMVCSSDLSYYDLYDSPPEDVVIQMQWLWLFPHYICPHYSNKPKYTSSYEMLVKKYILEQVLFLPLENQQAIYMKGDEREIL